MPDITLTPRAIYLEDLAVTTNASGETASVTVLGEATNPQTLNKIALIQLTDFGQYVNDAAAAAGGVAVGEIYYSTTLSNLKTRMT